MVGKNATLNCFGFKINANDVSVANMYILLNNTYIESGIDVVGDNISLFNNTVCVANSGFGIRAWELML